MTQPPATTAAAGARQLAPLYAAGFVTAFGGCGCPGRGEQR